MRCEAKGTPSSNEICLAEEQNQSDFWTLSRKLQSEVLPKKN